MDVGWIVVGLIVIIVVVYYAMTTARALEAQEADVMQCIQRLPGFHASQTCFVSQEGMIKAGILLDEESKQICILKCMPRPKTYLYRYSDILACEIIHDGVTVTRTSTSSMVGRALVGGVLLGPLGAVVGGLSAQKTSTSSGDIKRVDLRILVNSVAEPSHVISFLAAEGALAKATHWHGVLSVIIKQAEAENR